MKTLSSLALLSVLLPTGALADGLGIEGAAPHASDGAALGLGLSWEVPQLFGGGLPSSGFARVRFESGWAIEPRLAYERYSSSVVSPYSDASNLHLGATLRAPLGRRGDVRLSALGTLAAASSWTDGEPSTAHAGALGWGLGLEYLVGSSLSIGVDATSDVLAVSVFDGQDTHRWGPFLSPRYSLLAAMYF